MTRYRPSPAPIRFETLPEYVRRELNRISQGMQILEESLSADIAAGGGGGTITWQRGATWVAGGDGVVQAPATEVTVFIERSCAIKKVRVMTEASAGSCQIDVWAGSSLPLTVADSILSEKVSLSNTVAYADDTLSGFSSVSLTAGQFVTFSLDESTIFGAVTIVLLLEGSL